MVNSSAQPIADWLDDIISDLGLEVIAHRFLPAVKPSHTLPVEGLPLPDGLKRGLNIRGITTLSDFQWEAYQSIASGENTVIVAGTGSGKTEGGYYPYSQGLNTGPIGLDA